MQATKEIKDDLIEKTVQIRRVAKVVKGGRRFGFSAIVVVGDGKNRAAFGLGKANEISSAIKKAGKNARRKLKFYSSYKTTIPHEIVGRFCSGKVMMRPMPPGSGIIASLPVRAVIEALGISDINVKSLRSNNPVNLVKATFDGLSKLRTFEETAQFRGKSVESVSSIQY